jgi:uncharacterized protein (TIGR02302 family)
LPPSRDPNTPDTPAARLERLTQRTRAALIWEQIWPPLATAGAVAALFLAVSWAGLWFFAPGWARLAGLGLFAIALLAALLPLVRFRLPTREAALRRLDRDAPAKHGPATAFEDDLANAADPETQAMWALHRARVARQIEALKVAPPSPGMIRRDPRALRYAALLLAVAAGFGAGSQRYARLAAAFDFGAIGGASVAARVDAWIDPPAYAGQAPIVLKVADQRQPENLSVPEDSVIVLRASSEDFDAAGSGALKAVKLEGKPQSIVERRFTVQGDGEFRVTRNGARIATFALHAVITAKPTIALVEPPKPNASGSLALHYKIADAYGVASAEATFDSPGAGKHRLVEPPRIALSLPNAPGGIGEQHTTSDLSEHAWAGAEVTMTLRAADVAGKVGESEPIKLKLPQRVFTNPLAKALVEERRALILDPDGARGKVQTVLAALQLAPDEFHTSPSVYLGLRAAEARLARASTDPALIAVADLLWAMALQIEDGDASQTLKDLRAAEQKLRDALKNGASEEEIRELTKELRQLAERYMQEMAQNPQSSQSGDEPLDSKDLEAMLNQLEDSAKNGAKDDAQAMLDQLQDMFENMRGAQSAEESEAEKELRRQMSELNKLLKDQQALRDDTFKHDERERARRQRPDASPDNGDDADPQSLQQRQQDLRDRLEAMKRALKSLGAKGEPGFDDAQKDMEDAERDMQGKGDGQEGQGAGQGRGHTPMGDAVEAQGRALEALRKGAQGMQQQMQAAGKGKGNGYRAVGKGQGQGRDPLGRDKNGERGSSEGQLHEGPEAAARARQVQQELRRRLSDPNRPTDERSYIERLLKSE